MPEAVYEYRLYKNEYTSIVEQVRNSQSFKIIGETIKNLVGSISDMNCSSHVRRSISNKFKLIRYSTLSIEQKDFGSPKRY